MKLSSAQQRRLDREIEALELGGLDPKSARIQAEAATLKRVNSNKKRALWRRQREQCLSDLGLTKTIGPVSGKVYWE